MPPLRDTTTLLADCGKSVPIDNRDLLAMIGEHSSRKQPSHAPADDDGVFHIRFLNVNSMYGAGSAVGLDRATVAGIIACNVVGWR
jgi:hypothetical protein